MLDHRLQMAADVFFAYRMGDECHKKLAKLGFKALNSPVTYERQAWHELAFELNRQWEAMGYDGPTQQEWDLIERNG